jgi:hypothetical protein
MNRDEAAAVKRSQDNELLKIMRQVLAEMQDLTTVLLSINRYMSDFYELLPIETTAQRERAKAKAEKARSLLRKKLNRPHLL